VQSERRVRGEHACAVSTRTRRARERGGHGTRRARKRGGAHLTPSALVRRPRLHTYSQRWNSQASWRATPRIRAPYIGDAPGCMRRLITPLNPTIWPQCDGAPPLRRPRPPTASAPACKRAPHMQRLFAAPLYLPGATSPPFNYHTAQIAREIVGSARHVHAVRACAPRLSARPYTRLSRNTAATWRRDVAGDTGYFFVIPAFGYAAGRTPRSWPLSGASPALPRCLARHAAAATPPLPHRQATPTRRPTPHSPPARPAPPSRSAPCVCAFHLSLLKRGPSTPRAPSAAQTAARSPTAHCFCAPPASTTRHLPYESRLFLLFFFFFLRPRTCGPH
jgi:hypothetical protein